MKGSRETAEQEVLPGNSGFPQGLALLPAAGSGLKNSWKPMTLFMSHGNSARGSGKGKLSPKEIRFPRSNIDKLDLNDGLVPSGPDAFVLKEKESSNLPIAISPNCHWVWLGCV